MSIFSWRFVVLILDYLFLPARITFPASIFDYVSFFSCVLCGMSSLHRPCTDFRRLDGTDVRAFLFSHTEKPGTGNTPVLCPAPGNFFSFYVKRCRHPSMAMYFFSSIPDSFGSAFGMLSFNTPLSYFAWISSCFTSSPT